MNKAEIAAAVFMCVHRKNSNIGVRKMPPPVPVIPERKPIPAPKGIAAVRCGAWTFSGSLREKDSRKAEQSRTPPTITRSTCAGTIR